MAVRFAGGEFLVLFVNVLDEAKTIELANNLRERLAETYLETKIGDHFKKTVCIGVSMFPEDSMDIDVVIKNASDAVSDARDTSRNIVQRYESNEGMIDLF
jgi:diguanylate cyclase (GGDEF)-like protein